MTRYYVANANGDWWQISDEEGATLWVVDEATLAQAVAGENPDLPEIDLNSEDKLERAIKQHGRQVALDLEGDKFAEGVCYALDYLSSLYDGVFNTDLAEEFDPDNYESLDEEEEEEENA